MTTYYGDKIVLNDANWNVNRGQSGIQGNLAGYRAENLSVDEAGTIYLTAWHEPYVPQWSGDPAADYTSARIDTKGKISIPAGYYVDSLVQLPPDIPGVWAAFWAVGSNEAIVGWPACGEVDMVEMRGPQFPGIWRNLHASKAGGTSDVQVGWADPHASSQVDFTKPHWLGFDHDGNGVRMYLDGAVVQTITKAAFTALGGSWPFAAGMDIIANIAVGSLAGTPDPAQFPVTMAIGPLTVVPVSQRPVRTPL